MKMGRLARCLSGASGFSSISLDLALGGDILRRVMKSTGRKLLAGKRSPYTQLLKSKDALL